MLLINSLFSIWLWMTGHSRKPCTMITTSYRFPGAPVGSAWAAAWWAPENQLEVRLLLQASLSHLDRVRSEKHTSTHCSTVISTGQKSRMILTTNNLTKQLFWSVSEKRHASYQELVQNDPHRPPIHRLPVPLPQDHLWRDVFRGATHLWQSRKKHEFI